MERWLESFIVMSRYHHIRYRRKPDHYYFYFWQHLHVLGSSFETYLDPDTLDPKQIAFGIGERPNSPRLIVGL